MDELEICMRFLEPSEAANRQAVATCRDGTIDYQRVNMHSRFGLRSEQAQSVWDGCAENPVLWLSATCSFGSLFIGIRLRLVGHHFFFFFFFFFFFVDDLGSLAGIVSSRRRFLEPPSCSCRDKTGSPVIVHVSWLYLTRFFQTDRCSLHSLLTLGCVQELTCTIDRVWPM
jgi:hypothetical protein